MRSDRAKRIFSWKVTKALDAAELPRTGKSWDNCSHPIWRTLSQQSRNCGQGVKNTYGCPGHRARGQLDGSPLEHHEVRAHWRLTAGTHFFYTEMKTSQSSSQHASYGGHGAAAWESGSTEAGRRTQCHSQTWRRQRWDLEAGTLPRSLWGRIKVRTDMSSRWSWCQLGINSGAGDCCSSRGGPRNTQGLTGRQYADPECPLCNHPPFPCALSPVVLRIKKPLDGRKQEGKLQQYLLRMVPFHT